MAYEALKAYADRDMAFRFVSNVMDRNFLSLVDRRMLGLGALEGLGTL